MPRCCIIVQGKMFYWRAIKLIIIMTVPIYLQCLRNKEIHITQKSKTLAQPKCNSTTTKRMTIITHFK